MTRIDNNTLRAGWARLLFAALATVALFFTANAHAAVAGETGTSFALTATDGQISVSDGGSIYMWGYSAPNGSTMQLPGPTLIVPEGQLITVTLNNDLPNAAGNTSIVFPGHEVSFSGGVDGDLTQEAAPGGSVTYTFTAGQPGTYQYHSGSQPDLQVEMGLYGTLIVRPSMPVPAGMAGCAYNHVDSCYDREFLYVLSEIDLDIHEEAAQQAGSEGQIVMPLGAYVSEYWLMNGRAAPDTMAPDNATALPTQPYGSLTTMHPGEKLLVRLVGAGREMHPFHTHGNHVRVLAHDGRMMLTETTDSLAGPTLFTIPTLPGGTVDAIFEWTGKGLGWDMYGHSAGGVECIDDDNDGFDDPGDGQGTDWEWCADHNKPIPVDLPAISSLGFGGFYSGSPYLGALGALPPGEGGLNPNAGFAYMWHSHTERELLNNDIYPGGMLTMLIVEARGE